MPHAPRSFEYVSKFKNKISENTAADCTTPENKLLLMQIILKSADVGHPAKVSVACVHGGGDTVVPLENRRLIRTRT